MSINENRSTVNNYLVIVKTLHGNPAGHIAVVLKGLRGLTDRLPLGPSHVQKSTAIDSVPNRAVLVAAEGVQRKPN